MSNQCFEKTPRKYKCFQIKVENGDLTNETLENAGLYFGQYKFNHRENQFVFTDSYLFNETYNCLYASENDWIVVIESKLDPTEHCFFEVYSNDEFQEKFNLTNNE
jgi:hypothetical protein